MVNGVTLGFLEPVASSKSASVKSLLTKVVPPRESATKFPDPACGKADAVIT